jgi:hypothetical protein
MNNEYKKQNLLRYINKPISREAVIILYDANNIKYDKCELYGDFVQSLLMLGFDTYMGDDITSIEQQVKHFKWCWDKNIENFAKEGISVDNPRLYNYFLEFMLEVFYSSGDKKASNGLLKLWCDIFDYNKPKTNSDMDTLVEIYKLMDNSLKVV